MTVGAYPPNCSIAERRYHFRSHIPVFGGMPLCRNLRELAGKIVFSGNNLIAGADGAAGFVDCAGTDRRVIAVALFAFPPYLESAPV